MKSYEIETSQRIQNALGLMEGGRVIEIGSGVIEKTAEIFENIFPDKTAIIIADMNTYTAAGKQVENILDTTGISRDKTFIFDDDSLYAEMKYIDQLVKLFTSSDNIPIAVGSGTINDLVKLASYRTNRKYLIVVTAGSVDGYTAFGASISDKGFKQTFYCPAPQAVIVDLDIIADAPIEMNAWGYADLCAKIPAGADWILADALDVESIDKTSWNLVQKPLRRLISNPSGIRQKDYQSLCFLMEGLIMSGLAMQWLKSSRPASGAEHQFSHLWDNQHHRHNGKAPSHGFKVAVGSMASIALYESFIELAKDSLQDVIGDVKTYWRDFSEIEREIKSEFTKAEESKQIIEQSRAKYVPLSDLERRVKKAVSIWPELKLKLKEQLIDFIRFQEMLREVNAPVSPLDIGIGIGRLKASYRIAQLIRKRYTILDFTKQLGLFETCVDNIFQSDQYWKL